MIAGSRELRSKYGIYKELLLLLFLRATCKRGLTIILKDILFPVPAVLKTVVPNSKSGKALFLCACLRMFLKGDGGGVEKCAARHRICFITQSENVVTKMCMDKKLAFVNIIKPDLKYSLTVWV